MGWNGYHAMNAGQDCLFCTTLHFGGPKSAEIIKEPLGCFDKSLMEIPASAHLNNLERFDVWIFVAGEVSDYDGKQGPHRFSRGRNPPRLIIDLNIGFADYVGLDEATVRKNIADGFSACFERLFAKAVALKAVKSPDALREVFYQKISEFTAANSSEGKPN